MSNLGEQAMEILDELHTERLSYESEYVPLADAANLLTAYEQTGMDPEAIERVVDAYGRGLTLREDAAERLEIIRGLSAARLRELAEADRDGRCVVLPCKVGSEVWRIYDDCEFPGDCGTKQKCNGCEYRNIFAEKQAFCLSMLSQNGKLGHPYYMTFESAEAAMKGEQDATKV